MIYMCGTDLEPRAVWRPLDLSEMTKATIIIPGCGSVFTGGVRSGRILSFRILRTRSIKIESGGVEKLVDDLGSSPMTDPENLGQFIVW